MPASAVFKLVRFGISGVLSTLFYGFLAFVLGVLSVSPILLVHCIAFMLSIPVSYMLQRYFTFRFTEEDNLVFVRFSFVAAVSFVISTFIVHVLANKLDMPSYIVVLTVMGLVPIISFLAMQFWVFVVRDTDEKQNNTL